MIARGTVVGARGGFIELALPCAELGATVTIATQPNPTSATLCALDPGGTAFAAVHGASQGIIAGMKVWIDRTAARAPLGTCALGRAIDARAQPLDAGPALSGPAISLDASSPSPSARVPVTKPIWTGVRAIDALMTVGAGARIGVFGAPGLGKSTLLETIVRGVSCDAVVVALVGERGREAQRWIERIDARPTIVCATSDRTAAERVRAADLAMAQAGALRGRGLDVLVVFDSLARYAGAARELAVAAGESVGRGGFPPSVIGHIARLLERCGPLREGTMTLLATVLNDGDDRDPISEAARSLLDGHIQLSSELAGAGRYPAIDVSQSVSRTMAQVATPEHLRSASAVRWALALLARTQEARSLGITCEDPGLAAALRAETALRGLMEQGSEPIHSWHALAALGQIADTLGEPHGYID
ncbi:MAG: EscN/YscN/HrcN family type III secretion system ATPase [Vulcanimicrobiaceae bacterium]